MRRLGKSLVSLLTSAVADAFKPQVTEPVSDLGVPAKDARFICQDVEYRMLTRNLTRLAKICHICEYISDRVVGFLVLGFIIRPSCSLLGPSFDVTPGGSDYYPASKPKCGGSGIRSGHLNVRRLILIA